MISESCVLFFPVALDLSRFTFPLVATMPSIQYMHFIFVYAVVKMNVGVVPAGKYTNAIQMI